MRVSLSLLISRVHDENEAAGASWQFFFSLSSMRLERRSHIMLRMIDTYIVRNEWKAYLNTYILDVRRSIDTICFERLFFFFRNIVRCAMNSVRRVAQSVLVTIEWNFFSPPLGFDLFCVVVVAHSRVNIVKMAETHCRWKICPTGTLLRRRRRRRCRRCCRITRTHSLTRSHSFNRTNYTFFPFYYLIDSDTSEPNKFHSMEILH